MPLHYGEVVTSELHQCKQLPDTYVGKRWPISFADGNERRNGTKIKTIATLSFIPYCTS